MAKKIIALLFALVISVFSVMPAFAQSELPRLVDHADVLTDSEEADLLAQLDEVSERHQFDLVVLTVNEFGEFDAMTLADDFYETYGYGFGPDYDGSLLLIGIEEDYRCISTDGSGEEAFTDAGIQYIGSEIVNDLQSGWYYDGINSYIALCDDFLTQYEAGTPYDVDNMPDEKFNIFGSIIISLVVGAVIALIVTLIMKGQLKSVRYQSAASNYLKAGSMKVTLSREFFLYRNVSKVKKADNNSGGSSTHVSSSGRSHGGGGF